MIINDFNTNKKVLVIAEIGNNHEGSYTLAEELIGLASEAGVDAVKFQTFKTQFYVSQDDKDRYDKLKSFELSQDEFEKLKNVAVEKGKPVYFRALPPRDRKLIHQFLAEDGRVKSRSVGEGVFKKIKIFPIKGSDNVETTTEAH